MTRLYPGSAPQIGMHHAALDRSGAHDGDFDHQIVETFRLHAREHGLLRTRLDLEHADGVGAAHHLIHAGIFGRHVGHGERLAAILAHQIQRAADGGEHAQRQHVHLEQAERVEVVFVPLDYRAVDHGRVFDRYQPRQRSARDDEATHMLRQMARKADDDVHQRDQPLNHRIVGIEAGLAQPLRPHAPAVPPGQALGQPVHLGEVQPQRLAHVAQRTLGTVGDDGGSQCCAVATVFAVDILNDLLASLVLEVHVDVRRLVALFRDEPLEQHLHARRGPPR